jgi:hypothetical protein
MSIRTFIKSLTATSVRRSSPASRLCLEMLEDRTAPAFLAPASYPVGFSDYPSGLVNADFNRDGALDIATAQGVILGNGDGSFQPAWNFPPGGEYAVLGVGDFNQDGNPDLAGSASVLLSNGDGTFGLPLSINWWPARSLAVGDLNSDGKADLVTASEETNGEWSQYYINVILGNGDGTFAAPWSFETTGITSIALADFNLDGFLDAAIADYDSVAISLNNGYGALQWTADYSAEGVDYVSVADFNGDAKPDLAATGDYSDRVYTMQGNGDGTFQSVRAYPNSFFTGGHLVGDFNGDGNDDLATPKFDGSVRVFAGNGDGTLGQPIVCHIDAATNTFTSGDFNGDGFPDLAGTASVAGWPIVRVVLNDANWPPAGVPSVSVSDTALVERNTNTRVASFTVTLSAPYSQPVTVAYATANGSAAGHDYQATSGTLTIPAGQTTGTIAVLVNGDRIPELNETFVVNLSSLTTATIADSQATGTIVDDEPRLSISDMSKKEGKKNQTTPFTFTVALSAAYDQPVTMSFRTINGTATIGDGDYVAKSGTLTFAPGETTKTITISVKGDSKKESNETFYLDLFGLSSNAQFTKNRGIGTILNDD